MPRWDSQKPKPARPAMSSQRPYVSTAQRGRTFGFCKLIADRATHKILGCHVVGERAVEITQVAAIAIAAGMSVDELARVPLSFPTYAGILGRVAASVARQLNLEGHWNLHEAENRRS